MELHQVAPDTPGIYSYHVCVEPVTSESKTENNCSDTVEITVNPVDHGGTWAEATRLPLRLTSDLWEGSLSGKMQKGSDVDYFKVEIPEDGKLTVWTTGDLTTFGKLSGSNISIDGDLEDFLDSRGGPGDNFQIQRDVSRGTYYVKVTAAGTGSYTIHARFAPNVPCDSPRVHVIWYRAVNEELREYLDYDLGETGYITPKNVEDQLEHLQEFFKEKIGETFEYVPASNNKVVNFIHSNNFYVSNPKVSIGVTYNPKIHFKDDEGSAGDFLDKVWNDIKTNHPTGLNLNPLKDIYLVLVQSEYGYLGEKKEDGATRGIADIGGHRAMVALGPFDEPWNDERVKLLMAHELGHAFGLYHDFDEQGHIMSYNWERAGPPEWWGQNDRLFANTFSERSWNWLRIHPAFNTYTSCNVDTPIEIKVKVKDAAGFFHQPTTLTSYGYYLPDSVPVNDIYVSLNSTNGKYKIHLDIADLDGLHQVELIVPPLENSKGCPAGGCGSDNLSLARYLSPGSPDEEGVSGNFSSGHTTWSGTFDITKWMKQAQERDMDGFFADIATTDKIGNRSGFRLRIYYEASGSTAAAPFAQKHLPKETALFVNYPNPFNPETWIPYQLATPADVTLTIHDLQGRVVRDLDLGHQRAGMYHNRSRAAHWDGKNAQGESVASGVYFYTLTAGEFTATRKMLIRK
ncbi:MAG: T9SS type A sorting domain-containing protein [Candidatus Poribacteria bacterium]|nr:T9SS type A sorting domain-containing protein [Candidatus Poribacteria bacterium]